MAYIPKEWKDLPDETTPIQASDLNHIEQGVSNLSTDVDTLNANVGDLSTNVDTLNTNVGDLNTLNTTDKSSIVGAINESNARVGKKLWEGNFSSGSITVEGISNYHLICVNLGSIICLGSIYYGLGGIGGYASYSTSTYAYRFSASGDTLTIDDISKGGTDGSKNVPVTAIYGIF